MSDDWHARMAAAQQPLPDNKPRMRLPIEKLQSKVGPIWLDDVTALMSLQTFKKLDVYDCSMPTGVYDKVWRRGMYGWAPLAMAQPTTWGWNSHWVLGRYQVLRENADGSKTYTTSWHRIVIFDGRQPDAEVKPMKEHLARVWNRMLTPAKDNGILNETSTESRSTPFSPAEVASATCPGVDARPQPADGEGARKHPPARRRK